jgi:hypothetical protein
MLRYVVTRGLRSRRLLCSDLCQDDYSTKFRLSSIASARSLAWLDLSPPAINTHQHPRSSGLVLESVDPLAVLVGLFDSYLCSVAQGLR